MTTIIDTSLNSSTLHHPHEFSTSIYYDVFDPLTDRFDINMDYDYDKETMTKIQFENISGELFSEKQLKLSKRTDYYETSGHTYLIKIRNRYRFFWDNITDKTTLTKIFKDVYSLFEAEEDIDIKYIGETNRIDIPYIMDKNGFINLSNFKGEPDIDNFIEKYKEFQKLYYYFNKNKPDTPSKEPVDLNKKDDLKDKNKKNAFKPLIGISTRCGKPNIDTNDQDDYTVSCSSDVFKPFSSRFSFISLLETHDIPEINNVNTLLYKPSKMVHFIENIDHVKKTYKEKIFNSHLYNNGARPYIQDIQHKFIFNSLDTYECIFNENIRKYYFPDIELSNEELEIKPTILKTLIEQLEFQEFDTIEEFKEFISKENLLNLENEITQYLKNHYENNSDLNGRKQHSELINELSTKLSIDGEKCKELKKILPKILINLGYQKKRYASGIFWYGFKEINTLKTDDTEGYQTLKEIYQTVKTE